MGDSIIGIKKTPKKKGKIGGMTDFVQHNLQDPLREIVKF